MSSPEIEASPHLDVLYISIETLIALVSVFGNVLVVIVVCINRALRNTTFCFVVSLAVADVAVGALVIPLAVIISMGFHTQFQTCLLLSCSILIFTQSSILSLLAIAIDRFLRARIPTRYNHIMTQRIAYVAVCTCWILSFIFGMVPIFGWNNRAAHGNINRSSEIVCLFTDVIPMDYLVYFSFFGWVIPPLIIMIILYVEIFRLIRKQLNRRAEATSDAQKYYQKELKLAKSLALVLFLFMVCWLPLHIMNCIRLFCPKCNLPIQVVNVGIVLSHLNSAVNPMVYAFRIKRFRRTLVELSRRYILCRSSQPFPLSISGPGFPVELE